MSESSTVPEEILNDSDAPEWLKEASPVDPEEGRLSKMEPAQLAEALWDGTVNAPKFDKLVTLLPADVFRRLVDYVKGRQDDPTVSEGMKRSWHSRFDRLLSARTTLPTGNDVPNKGQLASGINKFKNT